MSMNIRKSFKNNVALPLTLALSIAASPMAMAENSTSSYKSSGSNISHSVSDKKTSTETLYDISLKAEKASDNLGTVGVYINRAPKGFDGKPEASSAELVEVMEFLLEEQGLNRHLVTIGEASRGNTSFEIYVKNQGPKLYVFGNLEGGITIAKADVERSIRIAEFDRKIISGEITAPLASVNYD